MYTVQPMIQPQRVGRRHTSEAASDSARPDKYKRCEPTPKIDTECLAPDGVLAESNWQES